MSAAAAQNGGRPPSANGATAAQTQAQLQLLQAHRQAAARQQGVASPGGTQIGLPPATAPRPGARPGAAIDLRRAKGNSPDEIAGSLVENVPLQALTQLTKNVVINVRSEPFRPCCIEIWALMRLSPSPFSLRPRAIQSRPSISETPSFEAARPSSSWVRVACLECNDSYFFLPAVLILFLPLLLPPFLSVRAWNLFCCLFCLCLLSVRSLMCFRHKTRESRMNREVVK